MLGLCLLKEGLWSSIELNCLILSFTVVQGNVLLGVLWELFRNLLIEQLDWSADHSRIAVLEMLIYPQKQRACRYRCKLLFTQLVFPYNKHCLLDLFLWKLNNLTERWFLNWLVYSEWIKFRTFHNPKPSVFSNFECHTVKRKYYTDVNYFSSTSSSRNTPWLLFLFFLFLWRFMMM